MEPFDEGEYRRWLRAAGDELEQARTLQGAGYHHGTVLHAEQAAQLAFKGLLYGAGCREAAWGRGLGRLADRGEEHAALSVSDALRARLSRLEREYLPTRYPDALTEGTPADKYAASDGEEARRTAEDAVATVRAAWAELLRAAGAAGYRAESGDTADEGEV